MTLTVFREAPLPDGTPGPVSMRRILAAFFALAAVALSALALVRGLATWEAFLPAGGCIAAVLLLMFFTTWGDVAAAWAAVRGRS